MKKILIIIALFFALLIGPAFAANTVNTLTGRVVQVSAIDSDFDMVATAGLTSYASGGAPIKAIFFYPGAANDVCVIKQATDAGPVISKLKSLDGEPRVMYFYDALLKPYLDYTDCTLSSGAFVVIILGKP